MFKDLDPYNVPRNCDPDTWKSICQKLNDPRRFYDSIPSVKSLINNISKPNLISFEYD